MELAIQPVLIRVLSFYSPVGMDINIVLSSVARKRHPHGIPVKGCRNRLIYETVISYYLMAVIDLIMLQRVYGLYKRAIVVRATLVALFLMQISQYVAVVYVVFPRARYTCNCVITSLNPAMISSFVFLEIILHAAFTTLIAFEKRRHERSLGPQTIARIAPVLNTHVKHGCIVLTFMSVYAILVIASTFRGSEIGPATFSVFP
ncbi:hypothetical protein BDQ17DRAFT_1419202 [Cyathus striatus]|nr:hypothetical protein BDQ17DRAFT_1419202 [Cyathus striatus]